MKILFLLANYAGFRFCCQHIEHCFTLVPVAPSSGKQPMIPLMRKEWLSHQEWCTLHENSVFWWKSVRHIADWCGWSMMCITQVKEKKICQTAKMSKTLKAWTPLFVYTETAQKKKSFTVKWLSVMNHARWNISKCFKGQELPFEGIMSKWSSPQNKVGGVKIPWYSLRFREGYSTLWKSRFLIPTNRAVDLTRPGQKGCCLGPGLGSPLTALSELQLFHQTFSHHDLLLRLYTCFKQERPLSTCTHKLSRFASVPGILHKMCCLSLRAKPGNGTAKKTRGSNALGTLFCRGGRSQRAGQAF